MRTFYEFLEAQGGYPDYVNRRNGQTEATIDYKNGVFTVTSDHLNRDVPGGHYLGWTEKNTKPAGKFRDFKQAVMFAKKNYGLIYLTDDAKMARDYNPQTGQYI